MRSRDSAGISPCAIGSGSSGRRSGVRALCPSPPCPPCPRRGICSGGGGVVPLRAAGRRGPACQVRGRHQGPSSAPPPAALPARLRAAAPGSQDVLTSMPRRARVWMGIVRVGQRGLGFDAEGLSRDWLGWGGRRTLDMPTPADQGPAPPRLIEQQRWPHTCSARLPGDGGGVACRRKAGNVFGDILRGTFGGTGQAPCGEDGNDRESAFIAAGAFPSPPPSTASAWAGNVGWDGQDSSLDMHLPCTDQMVDDTFVPPCTMRPYCLALSSFGQLYLSGPRTKGPVPKCRTKEEGVEVWRGSGPAGEAGTRDERSPAHLWVEVEWGQQCLGGERGEAARAAPAQPHCPQPHPPSPSAVPATSLPVPFTVCAKYAKRGQHFQPSPPLSPFHPLPLSTALPIPPFLG